LKKSKTGLIFFPAFDWAISPTHPEREERLLYTRDQIFEEGIIDLPEIIEYTPGVAGLQDIARAHFCVPAPEDQVTQAHLIAAGAALHLADKILSGEVKNGFALVRPPGHHAMRVVHGNRGFCNINNEAILIEYLRCCRGIKRVAVIDSDCHHGDGTQDIFFHDPDVLFISFHQDPRTIFPGTGYLHELGGPNAFARTLNIPLPVGAGDRCIASIVDNLILPVLEDFRPDFIINSAGQDNHFTDPLGSMKATAKGYAMLTEKLKPDMAVLEGGYAIESALPYVNMGIILALAGLDYSYVIEPGYTTEKAREDSEVVGQVQKMVEDLRKVWVKRDSINLDKIFGKGTYWSREKSIFYDTDSIIEKQIEEVRRCNDCAGVLTVDSQAAHGLLRSYHIYAVSIPIGACSTCREIALEKYERAKREEKYRYVYLQDKPNDAFITYRRSAKREVRLGKTGGAAAG